MRKLLGPLLLASALGAGELSHRQQTLEDIGDALLIIIPASAYGATLYLQDTQGQYAFYKSFGATLATTYTLKYSVQEERPNGENTRSFPSGHTSTTFQSATFIHMRYGLKYAALAYIGATFTAYTRVESQHHYTHDVIAGALIGSVFSWIFTDAYKMKDSEIKPVVFNTHHSSNNYYGLKMTW